MSKRKIIHVLYLHLECPICGLDVLNITMHTFIYLGFYHAYRSVIHSMNAYVWCWSKICGTLMKLHLLQWEVVKVK